jgi:uncharacterized membrane protein YcaP (DUF421 family)
MGKRQVGELEPFDLVIAILMAELAGNAISDDKLSLIGGVVSIGVLLLAQVLLAYICLKNVRARAFISGRPSIIIRNGKIVEEELKRHRYNISDLLAQLRARGTPNILDVEFAILENNGDLTVIPKSQKRPLTPQDVGIYTSYEGIPVSIIMDGALYEDNLEEIGLSKEWLMEELKSRGIGDVTDVLFASIDTAGTLFVQEKGSDPWVKDLNPD